MVPASTIPYQHPSSPTAGYVRALVYTLILALVAAIAFTVFQGSPQDHVVPVSSQYDAGNAVDAGSVRDPQVVDAQPLAAND